MAYKDKEKQREAALKWYHKNKEARQEKVKKERAEGRLKVKEFIWDHKKNNPCVDCGEDDPIVLDFDHVRGEKKFTMARATSLYRSLKKVKEEIAKCEIRCANCHRKVTHKRDERYRSHVRD
tara:strand:+ start:5619 stop:5984 length:366 start_codon:yes stop_codon:yes gene_type:complete